MREAAHYTMIAGFKRCMNCKLTNAKKVKVCRGCGRRFIKRPKAKKAARGSRERLLLEITHAEKMAERWAATSKRSLDTWHKWNRKARKLASRLESAKEKPVARRSIVLKELT